LGVAATRHGATPGAAWGDVSVTWGVADAAGGAPHGIKLFTHAVKKCRAGTTGDAGAQSGLPPAARRVMPRPDARQPEWFQRTEAVVLGTPKAAGVTAKPAGVRRPDQ